MRPLIAITSAALLCASTASAAAPDFVPSARQAFLGFTGLNPPRAELPVGSVWIKGYGPAGPGAEPANLERVRSLNGLTIDKSLQLSLSLGLLELLGIDPKTRNHYTARLADLSIVRVKDLSRLAGPPGAPRIVEALKAGSVTVSSDTGIAITGRSPIIAPQANVSTANERTRTYSMEARDMFIAVHVAGLRIAQGKEQELPLSSDERSARIDNFLITFDKSVCPAAPSRCAPAFAIGIAGSGASATSDRTHASAGGEALLKLPLPVPDQHGGFYDSLKLRWIPGCGELAQQGCRTRPRLLAHYEGVRLTDAGNMASKN